MNTATTPIGTINVDVWENFDMLEPKNSAVDKNITVITHKNVTKDEDVKSEAVEDDDEEEEYEDVKSEAAEDDDEEEEYEDVKSEAAEDDDDEYEYEEEEDEVREDSNMKVLNIEVKSSTSSFKEEKKHSNYRTQLCHSYTKGTVCPHGPEECGFAHTLEDHKPSKCGFGIGCRFILDDNGLIYNNTDECKICQFKHPTETPKDYYKRVGIPSEAVKTKEKKVEKTKEKKNVGKKKVGKKTTKVEKVKKKLNYITSECSVSKAVSVDSEMITIRVPKEMMSMALEAALMAGKTNIKLEAI
jgi:hypothetical protein